MWLQQCCCYDDFSGGVGVHVGSGDDFVGDAGRGYGLVLVAYLFYNKYMVVVVHLDYTNINKLHRGGGVGIFVSSVGGGGCGGCCSDCGSGISGGGRHCDNTGGSGRVVVVQSFRLQQ